MPKNKMSRRGQITIFIIVAITLLFAFASFTYLRGGLIKGSGKKFIESPLDIQPIEFYINDCIENIATDGLILVGKQGGYYKLPNLSINYTWLNTSYFYYMGNKTIPARYVIEDEISEYVNENLVRCIEDFQSFKELGYEIESGRIDTKTTMATNDVIVLVDYSISLTKEKSRAELSNFVIKLPVRLGRIYNVSESIINEQLLDPQNICLSCLLELGTENDLHIIFIDQPNETIIFKIRDQNSRIGDLDYEFLFANKYNLSLREINISEVIIESIPDMNATVDTPFIHDVNATGTNVTFIDHTYLFDINKTNGIINFTPTTGQVDLHTIWIEAKDIKNNTDFEMFRLNITENE